jgi:hypothetical protein
MELAGGHKKNRQSGVGGVVSVLVVEDEGIVSD